MGKIKSLQALRALAFIAIFLSHCDIIATGPMGVSIFLVLSGFLLTIGADGGKRVPAPGVRNNFIGAIRRIRKLYPLHVLTLLAMMVFDALQGAWDRSFIPKAGVNALLLQAWIGKEDWYLSFNKSAWYLSVCLFLYFVFPWMYYRIKIKSRQALIYLCGGTLAIVVTLSAILAAMESSGTITAELTKWITYICPAYRSWDFFMGMLLGKMYAFGKYSRNGGAGRAKASVLEAGLILFYVLLILLYRRGYAIPSAFRYSILWMPASLLAVWLFARSNGIFTRLLSNPVMVHIGNLSGVAFLTHQIIIGVTGFVIRDKWLLAVVAFLGTMIASGCYTIMERKIKDLLHAH